MENIQYFKINQDTIVVLNLTAVLAVRFNTTIVVARGGCFL